MTVEWPDRRADVLDALGAQPVLDTDGRDKRTPGPTDAVHAVVDDTWWARTEPSGSTGTLLVDEAEAQPMRAVVALVVDLSR